MIDSAFDIIVIGTGIGGSSSAALLSRGGLKTLVLEKNPRIGGACSFYEKDGFQVDFGTHLFARGGRGSIGEVLRRIGASVEFIQPRRLARIKGLGLDVPLYTSWRTVPKTMFKLNRQLGVPFREFPSLFKLSFDFFSLPDAEASRWDQRTIEEFALRYTRHPGVFTYLNVMMALYFVYPYWRSSAGEAIWCTKRMLKDQATSYPRGGAVAIPRAMLRSVEGHGGKVLTRARVRKIRIEGGVVRGVELTDGKRFSGRVVISTSSLKDTVFNLVGAKYFPTEFRRRVERIEESHNAVQAKIALDRKIIREGSWIIFGCPRGDYQPQRVDLPRVRRVYEDLLAGRIPELVPVYLVVPTNFDPRLAPPGRQFVTLCTGAPLTTTRLKDPPRAWVEAMLKTVKEALPGLEKRLLWMDIIGARAIERWIGKPGGPAISTVQIPGQVAGKRPPVRSPIPGLYFAGDCAGGRGIGTELAAQSGIECAELVISDFRHGLVP